MTTAWTMARAGFGSGLDTKLRGSRARVGWEGVCKRELVSDCVRRVGPRRDARIRTGSDVG